MDIYSLLNKRMEGNPALKENVELMSLVYAMMAVTFVITNPMVFIQFNQWRLSIPELNEDMPNLTSTQIFILLNTFIHDNDNQHGEH